MAAVCRGPPLAAVRLWVNYAEWLALELDAGNSKTAAEGSDEEVPVTTYAGVVNVYERALQLAGLHMVDVRRGHGASYAG